MSKDTASRAIVPPAFFVKLLMPFAIPMLFTAVLVIFVGERWPRNIAPGSGLKVLGFGAAVLTCLIVWHFVTRGIGDKRVHKMAALVCGVVGLMGWPVWSVGVLPSVNGFSLGPKKSVRMMLERTEFTVVSRSSARNHWAWLRPQTQDPYAGAGRYFISEATYRQWNEQRPSIVTVSIAQGLLGAQIVIDYE